MEQIFLATIILTGISVLCLSLGILIKGKFPNTHVSKTRHGISCAKTQDAEERNKNPHAIPEHLSTNIR